MVMKKLLILVFIFALGYTANSQNKADSLFIKNLYDSSLLAGKSYSMLHSLCKDVGHRLSGSPSAAAAVEWGRQKMKSLGFDTVYLQPIMVPKWVRGAKEESAIITVNGQRIPVNVLALGGSISTAEIGVEAEVIEVMSLNALRELPKDTFKNRIVFFNRPMNAAYIQTFEAYGNCVDQRAAGAANAAPYGALAVLVRSMSLRNDNYAHTGTMRHNKEDKAIPAAAISTIDADLLSQHLKANPKTKVYLKINSKWEEDVPSFNVVGEIKGTKYPKEIISVGGHLDSWDVGEGAQDDGAGCVHSIEAIRLLMNAGYKPQRTLRAVLFMNEENGLRGGTAYAEQVITKGEKHYFALESDRGGFTPHGFAFDVQPTTLAKMKKYESIFRPYGLYYFGAGGTGSDIGPLKTKGVALCGLVVDSQRYFDFHHAQSDVFENVNRRELELGAASISALLYLIDIYGL